MVTTKLMEQNKYYNYTPTLTVMVTKTKALIVVVGLHMLSMYQKPYFVAWQT